MRKSLYLSRSGLAISAFRLIRVPFIHSPLTATAVSLRTGAHQLLGGAVVLVAAATAVYSCTILVAHTNTPDGLLKLIDATETAFGELLYVSIEPPLYNMKPVFKNLLNWVRNKFTAWVEMNFSTHMVLIYGD